MSSAGTNEPQTEGQTGSETGSETVLRDGRRCRQFDSSTTGDICKALLNPLTGFIVGSFSDQNQTFVFCLVFFLQ